MTRKYQKRSTMTRDEALAVAEKYAGKSITEAAFDAASQPPQGEALIGAKQPMTITSRVVEAENRLASTLQWLDEIDAELRKISARIGL